MIICANYPSGNSKLFMLEISQAIEMVREVNNSSHQIMMKTFCLWWTNGKHSQSSLSQLFQHYYFTSVIHFFIQIQPIVWQHAIPHRWSPMYAFVQVRLYKTRIYSTWHHQADKLSPTWHILYAISWKRSASLVSYGVQKRCVDFIMQLLPAFQSTCDYLHVTRYVYTAPGACGTGSCDVLDYGSSYGRCCYRARWKWHRSDRMCQCQWQCEFHVVIVTK